MRAQQSWHVDAIRESYASGDKEWMLTAVFAMRFSRGFDAEILKEVTNADPVIRREAVLAAGNWELDDDDEDDEWPN